MPDSERETLEIPKATRELVLARDTVCRFCGRADERLCIHHIRYGGDIVGMGGRRQHDPENLVALGWTCHFLVHANKRLWMPLALEVVKTPGVTMLQLHRWSQRRNHGQRAPRRDADQEDQDPLREGVQRSRL